MLLSGISILDLSAYVGLAAVGAVTIIGMLMAFRYSPVRSWPHHRFNYFRLHNWSGYLALFLSILHPAILLFVKTPRFRLVDIAYPVHSPSQPLENTIGSIARYLLMVVVITSYFRIRLRRRTWKAFHFSIYFAAVALFVHSLLTDPNLKNAPIDWLDGGKIFIELSLILLVIVTVLRGRYASRKARNSRDFLQRRTAIPSRSRRERLESA